VSRSIKLKVSDGSIAMLNTISDKCPDVLRRHISNAMRSGMALVQTDARTTHRWNTVSGDLSRAITSGLEDDGGFTGFVEIDESVAPYGKYLHEGYKGREADPWVQDAFDKNTSKLEDKIKLAIERAFDELF